MSTATRLPRLLSLLPRDGLQATVYQARWAQKGLPIPSSSSAASLDGACYWRVEKVKLDLQGRVTGRAWGSLYWKGKRVTPEGEVEAIPGALKYNWAATTTPPLLTAQAQARLQSQQQQEVSAEA